MKAVSSLTLNAIDKAVEAAVEEGVSVEEFLVCAHQHWSVSLSDKARRDNEMFSKFRAALKK